MKVKIPGTDPKHYWLWCPGCNDVHMIDSTWSFNGNTEEPTFEPSILINGNSMFPNPTAPRCHSFVRNGEWDFLSDCTHKYAGLQVPMVDLPDHFNIDEA